METNRLGYIKYVWKYDSFQKNINFRNKCNILELRIQYAIWQPQDVENISIRTKRKQQNRNLPIQKEQRTFSNGGKNERNYKIERKQQLGNKQKSHKRTNDSNHESTEVLKLRQFNAARIDLYI